MCWDLVLRHWLWHWTERLVMVSFAGASGRSRQTSAETKQSLFLCKFFSTSFDILDILVVISYPSSWGICLIRICLPSFFHPSLVCVSLSHHDILLHILLQECDTHDPWLGVGRPSPFPPKFEKSEGESSLFVPARADRGMVCVKSECQYVKIQSVFDTGNYRTQVWNVSFDCGSPKVYGNQFHTAPPEAFCIQYWCLTMTKGLFLILLDMKFCWAIELSILCWACTMLLSIGFLLVLIFQALTVL